MSRPKPGREKKEEMEGRWRERRHGERNHKVTPEKPGDAEAMKERQQITMPEKQWRMRKETKTMGLCFASRRPRWNRMRKA